MYFHCVSSRHWPSPLKRKNAGPDRAMLVADKLANGEEPKESRLRATHNRYRDGVPPTAFPALFRTDNSEAGLALRISFLFWKEILKSSHVRDRSKCLGGSSS
jgi:hypothetical protein